MPLPYRVISAYEGVIQQFQKAAEDANAGTVRVQSSTSACFASSNGRTRFECYLYLKDWRWRPGKTNESVSIVVQACEDIADKELEILKSTVRVSYFTIEDECAKLLHTVHFDFDGHQENHPVFHAQLTGKAIVIPESPAKEVRFDCQVDRNEVPCFKNARIPTSDMTLSSVLLCLAADHMLAKFVRTYIDALKRIEDRLPAPRCDALRESLASGSEDLRSRHWFAHM